MKTKKPDTLANETTSTKTVQEHEDEVEDEESMLLITGKFVCGWSWQSFVGALIAICVPDRDNYKLWDEAVTRVVVAVVLFMLCAWLSTKFPKPSAFLSTFKSTIKQLKDKSIQLASMVPSTQHKDKSSEITSTTSTMHNQEDSNEDCDWRIYDTKSATTTPQQSSKNSSSNRGGLQEPLL